MRSRTRLSIKRSLCGLLAVLMSLQGIALASGGFAQVAHAGDTAAVATAAHTDAMPCDEMMMAMTDSVAPQVAPQTADGTAANEDCDGDCCDQGEGCGMVFCLAGSCLPATPCETQSVPQALVTAGEFPPPVLGTTASAQGPPLRPPIA